MNNQPDHIEVKLTPEQLKRIKKLRLIMLPARVLFALAFFTLICGGPRRFFAALPGPLFVLLFSVYLASERMFRTLGKSGKGQDRGSFGWLWAAFGSAYLAALLDFYWLRPHWALFDWNWIWPVVGTGLFVVGQSIRVLAIHRLGRFFNITVRLHPEHRIIKDGIYARVRHPAYTGILLVVAGFVTLFASVIGYAVLVLYAVPALGFRIRVEEKVLLEQFGDEYRSYCEKSKRLIPFVF